MKQNINNVLRSSTKPGNYSLSHCYEWKAKQKLLSLKQKKTEKSNATKSAKCCTVTLILNAAITL